MTKIPMLSSLQWILMTSMWMYERTLFSNNLWLMRFCGTNMIYCRHLSLVWWLEYKHSPQGVQKGLFHRGDIVWLDWISFVPLIWKDTVSCELPYDDNSRFQQCHEGRGGLNPSGRGCCKNWLCMHMPTFYEHYRPSFTYGPWLLMIDFQQTPRWHQTASYSRLWNTDTRSISIYVQLLYPGL